MDKSQRGRLGGHARAAKMTPEVRSAQASKAARARWGSTPKPPTFLATRVCPCLVYVMGPIEPSPQIWYEPLVNEAGKIVVKPEGMVIVGKPVQLPPRDERMPWSPEAAEAVVLRARKDAKNAA